ncbi:hypothetical protein [Gloeothece verrucosa]|uniref:KxDL domain-containing protein n=1 Tax=Gloeothece verrucosa (strain PCC 7822) TaxID=497965 RepID=E0UP11_GLOV7|nr:hypothetical protein [Gloeothece verrucosa]ADN18691.1 hypothetical protein Cyan7822_6209 [Gloeothece verrucosa PCC 7822]
MTTVTEADIKELKELINNRFDGLSQEIKEVKQDIKEVKQDVKELDKRLTIIEATLQAQQPLIQKITDLAEKLGELKNWKQIAIAIVSAGIGGLITWFIRGGRG